jgi:predicted porin
MQKKVLVLAVAAAISSPAFADSEVSVYGKVDMGLASTDSGAGGTSTMQVGSQVTKLGFKGAEDLGDGLSAIWQIEQQIDIDAAGSGNSTHTTFAGRNSFGGLKGDSWGTILMGNHDTPYKIATRGLDVFGDQLPDNRALMGINGVHDARLGNALAYISPDMNGFSAALAYVAGAESAATSGTVKGSAWSLAGMYKGGPLYAALAYQTIDVGSSGSGTMSDKAGGGVLSNSFSANDKLKAFKLGVGYTMDALQLNAVYEKTSGSGSAAAVNADEKNWYLAGVYNFGSDDVKLAYTHQSDVGSPSVANTGAKQFSVGYDHNMSKHTKAYIQYTKLTNDSGVKNTISTAGSTAGGQIVALGADPSAWIVGLYHSF